MKNKKRIVISGGGTLGHILPILPIIKEISNKYSLYFIGTKKGLEKKYLKDNDFLKYFNEAYFLDMEGINRKNIFKNFKVLYKYFITTRKIKKIYKKICPDLVIGMGGYISGMSVEKASKMKIKTIIHEQNTLLGLANKLSYKKVDKVLLSYDIESLNIENKVIVGNPRYSDVKEKYKYDDENNILIVGGSLGSKKINDIILNNIDYFLFENYKLCLVVGKKYYESNIKLINSIKKKYKGKVVINSFLNDLVSIMSKSTVVVSRSGATTIAELLALKVPSILIPSPNVTSNHQYYNALELKKKEACVLIEETDLTKEILKDSINHIITSFSYKRQLVNNMSKIITNDPKADFIKIIEEML